MKGEGTLSRTAGFIVQRADDDDTKLDDDDTKLDDDDTKLDDVDDANDGDDHGNRACDENEGEEDLSSVVDKYDFI